MGKAQQLDSSLNQRLNQAFGASLIAAGVAVAGWALGARAKLHPYSSIGWGAECALIALGLALGGCVLVSASRWQRPALGFGGALGVGLGALSAELRYWSQWLAALAALALFDSVAFAVMAFGRWPWVRRAALSLAFGCLATAGFYLAAGEVLWALQPKVPHAARTKAIPRVAVPGRGCDGLLSALDAPHRAQLTRSVRTRPAELRPVLCDLVRDDLARGASGQGLSDDIAFEGFRLDAYLGSSVVPKRYLGFFDEAGDTAAAEVVLRETVEAAVPIVNRFAERTGRRARVTEMEVAVTFLAEGGALLLTSGVSELDRIHPVRNLGLDNFRAGFDEQRELVRDLDAALGVGLDGLTLRIAGHAFLVRPMTFREGVAGTAVMYLWEKELCARRARRDGRDLMGLPLAAQFVTTSLFYNCGRLFPPDRVTQILRFATGGYLADLNRGRGTRPELPVYAPDEARRRLIAGQGFPAQYTSWSAVIHVLQRYGAFAGIARQGRVFDAEGRFRHRSTAAEAPTPPPHNA